MGGSRIRDTDGILVVVHLWDSVRESTRNGPGISERESQKDRSSDYLSIQQTSVNRGHYGPLRGLEPSHICFR